MNKNWETLISANSRIKKSGPRKPLRTISELAEEFGISKQSLSNFLMYSDSAPNPSLHHTNRTTKGNVWYDPDAVRKWWASR